jgi:two-component system NtrC family response regulator
VIAATHRDLAAAARGGAFREDLYYRLAVVPIHLPPLRERLADILPLAEHFLRQAGGRDLDAGAASLLVRQPWPGNVRQLRNAMQRVAVLSRSGRVCAQDLDFLEAEAGAASSLQGLDWPDEDLPTAIARLEELLIRRALRNASGNRTEAARRLNIRRQLLYAKLERYGLAVSAEGTDDVRPEDGREPGAK